MSEAAKIRATVMPYLEGKSVLDLGCGDEKIVPWAVGVDDASEWGPGALRPDIQSGIDPSCLAMLLEKIRAMSVDVVFSSHALEHMCASVREVVSCWLNFVKIGGHLILYVPDERYYVYDPKDSRFRNPAHRHLLTPLVMEWHMLHLECLGVLAIDKIQERHRDTGFPDEYSTLLVMRRLL